MIVSESLSLVLLNSQHPAHTGLGPLTAVGSLDLQLTTNILWHLESRA